MPQYAWTGRSRSGEIVSGIEQSSGKEALGALLRGRRILITAVKEKGREIALPTFGGGVTAKQIAIFTRQFSVMIDAGLPLVQCLEILGTQQDRKSFARVILEVRGDVEAGQSLSESMRRHPEVFDALYSNLIAAGEAGGILDTILRRLADYIEKTAKLRSQVKSAMIYPAAVIAIAALVVAVILWKVIPTFAELFAGLGATLPLPTLVVVWASQQLVRYGTPLLAALALVSYLVKRYHETETGRRVIDGLLLRAPILGAILRKIAVARFCRTLSTLTTSGVPILDGFEITAKTSGNAVIEDAIMATRRSVAEGRTIAEPLKATGVFPSMVVQMIAVGEQTGALDTMLAKIADFYEDEVDVAVAGLISLLEPVMIFVLGTVIGGIVVAMYLPIFTLIQNL